LNSPRDRLLGTAAVLAAASIWGTLGLFAKILYAEGVSFEALVAFRAVVGFAVVFGFVALTGRVGRLRVGAGDLVNLIPLGIVSIGAFYLLYFYTVQEAQIGTAAILLYSSPAFVVILARLFLKEALIPSRVVALLLTATGIFLVVGAYDPAALEVSPLIVLTGLGAGLSYGLYSVVGKPLTGRLPPYVIVSYILGVGAVVLVLFAIPTLGTLAGLSAGTYALLASTAVVHTALTYALYTFGLRRLEAGQAAILATVEPVVAGLLGVAFLSEALTAPKVIGALLVLGGAALAQVRARKPDGKVRIS
jgi:drug/metabolite transporter, DME family